MRGVEDGIRAGGGGRGGRGAGGGGRGGRDAVCLLRKKRKRDISDFYLSCFLDSSVFLSVAQGSNMGVRNKQGVGGLINWARKKK